ncbi:hypothetical protein HHI36_015630 [Cryptolaemus montrouzieri]|uniref:Nucleolar complex protein 2 homolog n=1 Tax=Cryptolaemus montrouzieri TaxID=559131 RepID=A0ABD2N6A2_9CUCU
MKMVKKTVSTKKKLNLSKNKKKSNKNPKNDSKYATIFEDDEFSDQKDSEPSDVEDLNAELEKEDESDNDNIEKESDEEVDDQEISVETEDDIEKHKQSLAKLKQTDPEFYKFLEENDKKLLKFNLSDEESEGDDESQGVHVPDGNLEVASDESDFEDVDGEDSKESNAITLKLLRKWQNDIRTDKTNKTLNILAQALHAALLRVSPDDNDGAPTFKVEGSAVFNAVVQLCVLEFGPAVRRFLGLSPGSKQHPHKCKKFIKIKKILKSYFDDLLKLLSGVASANIQTVLLKHLHFMSSMLASFPHSSKSILKQLIKIWGTADEGVRVIAFFCILRITRNDQASHLNTVLKSMYMTYVKNSKFVSTSTLASINFMRRSLVEMFALDLNEAYQHVFLYIRQLAIHLRNAITTNKKENIQAVYNWQYVNSLKLWGNLLCVTCNKPQLQQLVYPLVQVCLGTLKLVPTAQYYPLRFHVTQILMELSRDVDVFIPVLPFIVDVLNSYDFNKKHQRVSMKPLHFTCLLRLSKSQLGENGFKDTLIDTIYSQLLDYMTQQSHSISFPELSFICRVQMKEFLKKCKNANYSRKMKQVLEKIEQNAQFIENERKKVTLSLKDFKQIEGWESQVRNKGTPLSIYHESWSKMRNQKKRKEITNNEELGDYKLPTLKKSKVSSGELSEKKKKEGPVELFPSDSEEEEEVGIKRKRGKRGGKNINKVMNFNEPINSTQEDIVEDIDVNDW